MDESEPPCPDEHHEWVNKPYFNHYFNYLEKWAPIGFTPVCARCGLVGDSVGGVLPAKAIEWYLLGQFCKGMEARGVAITEREEAIAAQKAEILGNAISECLGPDAEQEEVLPRIVCKRQADDSVTLSLDGIRICEIDPVAGEDQVEISYVNYAEDWKAAQEFEPRGEPAKHAK